MQRNETSITKFGVDTAENEPVAAVPEERAVLAPQRPGFVGSRICWSFRKQNTSPFEKKRFDYT